MAQESNPPKPTVGFHERYANDNEFKRQVDEGRKRADEDRGRQKLDNALAMTQGKKPKLY